MSTTRDPASHKRLGRGVCRFDDSTWKSAREDIVLRGTHANLSQNANMRNALLATGDRVLAKARLYDRVWGYRTERKRS